ncbi:MAG: hypothetical protein HYU88_11140 [Chloroflexi bacterium]|nr:hypothetical protein [Chloroflexota bacterium]
MAIAIPAGALSQPATFAYQPVAEAPVPRGLTRPFLTFELTAETLGGTRVTALAMPVEIAVSYQGLSLIGVNEQTLRVEIEVSPGVWQSMPSTVDTQAKIVRGRTTHLSRFALVGDQGYLIALPLMYKVVSPRAGRGPGG